METLKELDYSLFRRLHVDWHREWLDPVFWVVSSTGLGWVQVLALLGAVAAGGVRQGEGMRAAFAWSRLRDWPLRIASAWALSGILNSWILKKAVPRDRPSRLVWADPQETFFSGSYPSGHTATSFGIAFAVFFLTRGTRHAWAGWAALVWAGLVGFSRVYRGVHWPTDVVGAALVGLFAACFVELLSYRRVRVESAVV